jgi:hypothetical protein
MQLFMSPSTYWHALWWLHMTVVCSQSWNPYARSIDNLTINDFMWFFAEQGVTKEEADDTFEYTYQWLTIATTERASQSTEIQSLLDEVNLAIHEAANRPPQVNGVQWWQLFFLWPAQLYAGQLPAEEHATLTTQYGPFDDPVEDLDPKYIGTIEASRHQLVPSDTVSLGHTSPESSIGPPASRPMTHITDPDSEMESGVAPSMLPASSALPLLAAAQDDQTSLAQTPATSSSMSLTFVRPATPITCINDPPYMDPYAQTLPYSEDTPMGNN